MRRVDLGVFAVLVALKLNTNLQHVDWGWDGGYYADIARNFAAGHGLDTSISMYHEGLPVFPFPTPVYPLWPLVLGVVATVVPMSIAAVWLPTLLYFGAVALIMQLGRRLSPGPLDAGLGLDAGHVCALVLGLNDRFFESTSTPYTEGLAMCLLGGAALHSLRLFRAPGFASGVKLGLWAAALLCVRGPWLPVVGALAVGSALPLFSGGGPGMLLGFFAGFPLGMVPLLLWYQVIPEARLSHLVFFERWRVQSGLSEVAQLVPAASLEAWLRDRAQGVIVAFTAPSRHGWARNYSLLTYAPWAVVIHHGRTLLRALPGWLREERAHPALLLLGVGMAQALALHGIHKQQGAEWNFATRHGLGALPLFLIPALWMLRQTGWTRALAVLAVCAMVGRGLGECIASRDNLRMNRATRHTWTTAVAALPPGTVASDACQHLVRFAPGVGCVEVHGYTTPADLDWMIAHQGVQALLLRTHVGHPLLDPTLPHWRPAAEPPGFRLFVPELP